MRRAARVDANHAEIIRVLRKAGCSVLDMSRLGGGAPDILIGYGGISLPAEIKCGAKPPSARKLTPKQREWHDSWTGGCRLILSPLDALETAATLRRWATALRQA